MKNNKKVKRITIRVTEDTYRRWAEAADSDERTLGVWIRRRIEGKPAQDPSTESTQEVAEIAPEVVESTAVVAETPAKTNLLARMKALAES